jgi:hypothetical protein
MALCFAQTKATICMEIVLFLPELYAPRNEANMAKI